jgi:hypothetical protein
MIEGTLNEFVKACGVESAFKDVAVKDAFFEG